MTVVSKSAEGEKTRVFHVKHLIFASGWNGGLPHIPEFAGRVSVHEHLSSHGIQTRGGRTSLGVRFSTRSSTTRLPTIKGRKLLLLALPLPHSTFAWTTQTKALVRARINVH